MTIIKDTHNANFCSLLKAAQVVTVTKLQLYSTTYHVHVNCLWQTQYHRNKNQFN